MNLLQIVTPILIPYDSEPLTDKDEKVLIGIFVFLNIFMKEKKYNHLDTQLFPECENKWCDRDIVKKTVKKKKTKHSFNLKKYLKNAYVGNTIKEEINVDLFKSNDKYFPTMNLAMEVYPEIEPEQIKSTVVFEYYKGTAREMDFPGDKPSAEIKMMYDFTNDKIIEKDELYGEEQLLDMLLDIKLTSSNKKHIKTSNDEYVSKFDYSDPIRDNKGKLIITPEMSEAFDNWTEYMKNTYEKMFDSLYNPVENDDNDIEEIKKSALEQVKNLMNYHNEVNNTNKTVTDKNSIQLLNNINDLFKKQGKEYIASSLAYDMNDKSCTFLCTIGNTIWQCQCLFDKNFKPYGIEFLSILVGGHVNEEN